MAKKFTHKNSNFWRTLFVCTLLLWVVCQSVLATSMSMPMDSMSDCCPGEVVIHHATMDTTHKLNSQTASQDHSDCEYCAFSCQFFTSTANKFPETFGPALPIFSRLFTLTTPLLDSPFRPPILS